MQNIGQLTIYKDGHLEENLIDLVPESSGLPEESVTRKNMERYVDPDMKAFIDENIASYDGVMSRKIGDLSVDLIKRDENGIDISRTQENGLCELAADAFRAVGGTQTALIGAGSVRADLEAGEVTYQDIVDILPYCNDVIITEVSGRMLLDALEFGVSFLPKQAAAFPQVSGITYRINKEMESSVRINEKKQFVSVDGEYRVSDVMIDGKELDPDAIYTLAIAGYLLTGGDGYTMFGDANIYSTTGLCDNEVVMKYIQENLGGVIPEKYAQPQGRILY
jgi:2',3'-cyclic-nucleotide 2'-phosphodiesterase (5'-nucleotidase family)